MTTGMYLKRVSEKLSSLNKKIDILTATYREYCNGRTSDTNLLVLSGDKKSDLQQRYQEWKSDILISYYRPKGR